MAAVTEVVQRLNERGGIVVQVAEDHHHAATRNAFRDVVKNLCQGGLAARFGLIQRFKDAAHLAGPRTGRQVGAQRGVEGDEPGGVLLVDQQVAEHRRNVLRVGEFRERPAIARRGLIASVSHRTRGVQ